MLVTRISFMNEPSRVAEKVGADIELVSQGIGSDPRIGTHFFGAGAGYGGAYFPQDVKALVRTTQGNGLPTRIRQVVESVNEMQKHMLVQKKVVARYGENLTGKTFALRGLAFKPNTDDLCEAPSRAVITEFTRRGTRIQAYDTVARAESERLMPVSMQLSYAGSANIALEGADALLIAAEWKEFHTPDFEALKTHLKGATVFDGRNFLEPDLLASSGLRYHTIGRA